MKKSLLFLIGFLFPPMLLAQGPRYHGVFSGDGTSLTNLAGSIGSTNVWMTLTPEMFGAKGDGSTLDDTAMAAAISALEQLNKNVGSARLYCAPLISYKLANNITLNGSDYLYGDAVSGQGANVLSGTGSAATFVFSSTSGIRVNFTGASGLGGIQLHNLSIVGSGTGGQFGVLFTGNAVNNGIEQSVLDNITIKNCDTGMAITNGADIYIHKLFVNGGTSGLICSLFLPSGGNGVNKYTVEGAHINGVSGFGMIFNGGIVNVMDADVPKMYFLNSHAMVKDCNVEPGAAPTAVSDGSQVTMVNVQSTGGSGIGLRETNNGRFILTDTAVSADINNVRLLNSNTDGREDSIQLDPLPGPGGFVATNINFANMTNRLAPYTLDFNSGNVFLGSGGNTPQFMNQIRGVATDTTSPNYPVVCYYDGSGATGYHWAELSMLDRMAYGYSTLTFNSGIFKFGFIQPQNVLSFVNSSGGPTYNQNQGINTNLFLWMSNSIAGTLGVIYTSYFDSGFARHDGAGTWVFGTNVASDFVGNGVGLTNMAFMVQTNFISGRFYTNTWSGSPQINHNELLHFSVQLTAAAVAGRADMDLLVGSSTGTATIASSCSFATGANTVAGNYYGELNYTVTNGQVYAFTNQSTGAGNSSAGNGSIYGQITFIP